MVRPHNFLSWRLGLLVLLHTGFEGITEVDTGSRGTLMSFKVILCNDRVLSVCTP